MDIAVSTSDLHAEGSLVENTSVAHKVNVGKLGSQKPEV